MELKSLILGIVLAVSIFAVKSGTGVYYLTARMEDRRRRIWVNLGSALSYGLLFLAAFFLLKGLHRIALFPLFNRILKYGMPLHFALAFGMLIWGIYLLKRTSNRRTSKAYLTLILPCPVCMTVILLITGFVLSYFPKDGGRALMGVFGVYLAIQIVTVGAFSFWQKAGQTDPDRTLGWGMLLIAGYFILTVLIAPQMGGLSKIYRIATYKGDTELLTRHWIIAVWTTLGLTFAVGVILKTLWLKRKG